MKYQIFKTIAVSVLLSIFLASVSIAGEAKGKQDIADVEVTGNTMDLSVQAGFRNITVSISGPANYYISKFFENTSAEVASLSIDLTDDGKESVTDGRYKYQISAATGEPDVEYKERYNNGRGKSSIVPFKSAKQNGHFALKKGDVLKSNSNGNGNGNKDGGDDNA